MSPVQYAAVAQRSTVAKLKATSEVSSFRPVETKMGALLTSDLFACEEQRDEATKIHRQTVPSLTPSRRLC